MNNDGYFEKDDHILSLKLALKRMNFQNGRRKLKSCSKTLKSRIKLDINILDSQTYYETLTVRKDFDLIYYRTYTNALMP